jgi:hypothetical protein
MKLVTTFTTLFALFCLVDRPSGLSGEADASSVPDDGARNYDAPPWDDQDVIGDRSAMRGGASYAGPPLAEDADDRQSYAGPPPDDRAPSDAVDSYAMPSERFMMTAPDRPIIRPKRVVYRWPHSKRYWERRANLTQERLANATRHRRHDVAAVEEEEEYAALLPPLVRPKRVVYRSPYTQRYAERRANISRERERRANVTRERELRANLTQERLADATRHRRHDVAAADDGEEYAALLPPLVRPKRVIYRSPYTQRYAERRANITRERERRANATRERELRANATRVTRHVMRRGEVLLLSDDDAGHHQRALVTPPWSSLETPKKIEAAPRTSSPSPPSSSSSSSQYPIPQCYRYGDCIDRHNTANAYYGQRLIRFVRDNVTRMIDVIASDIERRINITNRLPMTPLRYEPLHPCAPNASDVEGDVGTRFTRKAYETYALSDAVNAAYYQTRVLDEDLKGRLNVIYAKLRTRYPTGAARTPAAKPIRPTAMGGSPRDPEGLSGEADPECARSVLTPAPARAARGALAQCGRSNDCIDEATMVGKIILSNLKCYAAVSTSAIDTTFLNIETLLGGDTYAPRLVRPYKADTSCTPTTRDVRSVAYIAKVATTYSFADGTHRAFYDAWNRYRSVVDRLLFVGRLVRANIAFDEYIAAG